MRGIDAIFAAAGEAVLPFLQEAFEAGKREGRKSATEEIKSKIAGALDDEQKDDESNQPGSQASVHKLEQHQEPRPSQAGKSFDDELRGAIAR